MTTSNKALDIKTLQDSIVSFNSQINFKQAEIEYLKREQQALEVDPDNYSDQFDELLDEIGEVFAGGIGFYPSRILKELDPTAYRCGLNDYVDGTYSVEDLEEYKEMDEKIEELENEISDLEGQITEAEEEIEALEDNKE